MHLQKWVQHINFGKKQIEAFTQLALDLKLSYYDGMTDSAHLSSISVLTLGEASAAPTAEVGHLAHHFAHLLQFKLPLPQTFVLPCSILQHILEINNFRARAGQLFSEVRWSDPHSTLTISEMFQMEIRRMHIPKEVSKMLLSTYATSFEHAYLHIRPSFVSSQKINENCDEVLVQGEANFIESLLRVLAKLYHVSQLVHRYHEWQQGQIVPAALLIQEMIQADVSGTAMEVKSLTGEHFLVRLYANQGVTHHHHQFQELDMFEVNTDSKQIERKQIKVKQEYFVMAMDQLQPKKVAPLQQISPILDDNDVIDIAQAIKPVVHMHGTSHLVYWAITTANKKHSLYLIDAIPVPTEHPVMASSSKLPVFARIQDMTHFRVDMVTADGGIFESDALFQQFREHPQFLLQRHKDGVIQRALREILEKYYDTYPDTPFFYRLPDLTSQELLALQHGEDYETTEPNPYLGYHGAVRVIHDFRLFDVQIAALLDAQHQRRSSAQLNIILPSVRAASEFALIKKHLLHKTQSSTLPHSVWLECSTPENLLQIEQYLLHQPAGLIINTHSIQCLLQGIDPQNSEFSNLYVPDIVLLHFLLKRVKQYVQLSIKIYVSLPIYQRELIEIANELRFDAVVVPPAEVLKAKQLMKNI